MNNLEFAVINEYNRVKFNNELDVMTTEQENIIDELCDKSWFLVTEEDLIKFNFNDDFKTVYRSVVDCVVEVMENNYLEFVDKRCYSYLVDSVYEMIRIKM